MIRAVIPDTGRVVLWFVSGIRPVGLVGLVFLSFCSGRVGMVGHTIPPIRDDGVTILRMNSLADQPSFSGEWSVPRLGQDRSFMRVLRKPGGSVHFQAKLKESYLLQIQGRGAGKGAIVGIGGLKFPLDKDSAEFVISPEVIEPGANEIKFFVEDELKVSSIRILPRRIAVLAGADQALGDEMTLFMPGSWKYFLRPVSGERLLLSIDAGSATGTNVRIIIRTGSRTVESRDKVRSDAEFVIRPVPGQFQEIEVRSESSRSGILRLKKSLLVRERRHQAPRRIRKAVRDKSVLIICLDAARGDHLGALGYSRRTTPFIDRLARESWVFTDAVAEAAFTLASTTTLHTGLPPDVHRVLSTFTSSLGPSLVTVAELFQKKGYFTAAISANPYFGRAYGQDRGFAEFVELFEGAREVLAEDFLEPFGSILEHAGGRPFFIYLHLREPHQDYENLLYADSVIGRLLEILATLRLDGKTLKIIASDHGEGLGEHGMIGHNVVLQREGIHIPLIVQIPGVSPKRIPLPAITSDVPVTLADLFGLEYPYDRSTWGMNLFNLPAERRRLTRALNSNGGFPAFMAEQYPYRMIAFFPITEESVELYNIKDDPGQNEPASCRKSHGRDPAVPHPHAFEELGQASRCLRGGKPEGKRPPESQVPGLYPSIDFVPDVARPRAVELAELDALLGSEANPPALDDDGDGRDDERRVDVVGGIVFAVPIGWAVLHARTGDAGPDP